MAEIFNLSNDTLKIDLSSHLLAVDLGSSAAKCVLAAKDADWLLLGTTDRTQGVRVLIDSVVGHAAHKMRSTGPVQQVVIGNEPYVVGSSARSTIPAEHLKNTRNSDWAGSGEWKALMASSIAKTVTEFCKQSGVDLRGVTKIEVTGISLVTGVPEKQFQDREIVSPLIDQVSKIAHFTTSSGLPQDQGLEWTVQIDPDVGVYPQGSAALTFAAEALGIDLSQVMYLVGVDLGEYTADGAVVAIVPTEDGPTMESRFPLCFGVEGCIGRLREELGEHLEVQGLVSARPTFDALCRILQSRVYINTAQQAASADSAIEVCLSRMAKRIVDSIGSEVMNSAPYMALVTLGGGASVAGAEAALVNAVKPRFSYSLSDCEISPTGAQGGEPLRFDPRFSVVLGYGVIYQSTQGIQGQELCVVSRPSKD